MTRVCVIFGGANSEHEVSLRSATCILEHINREKYEVVMVGITKRGQWYHYTGPINLIASGLWETSPFLEPTLLSPDPREGGLLLLGKRPLASERVRMELAGKAFVQEKEKQKLRVIPIDVIFPVLHGQKVEDGAIQGLFELSEIPYVGCGVLSSAMCMDKEIAHIVLTHAGVKKTDLVAVRRPDFEYDNPEDRLDMLEETLGYPMFVKPANEGSSVGVTKAANREELKKGMRDAFRYDRKIVVERTLVGREIECSVWGNEDPEASYTLGEIIPTREFYDYEGKYEDDSTGLVAPAELEDEVIEKVRKEAVKAYRALECTGLARVDFFVLEDGTPVVNELNTLPGFTSISMFPRLLQEDGYEIPEQIDRLIEAAFSLKK